MNVKDMCEAQFYENFKISERQYEILLAKINNSANIVRSDFKLHFFLYFVSGRTTYRRIKEKFGCSKSTAHRHIEEIAMVLVGFASRSITFPHPNEFQELKDGMSKYGDSNVILALDGTEISITKPYCNGMNFYNRKQHFSITLLALVDHKLRFRAISY